MRLEGAFSEKDKTKDREEKSSLMDSPNEMDLRIFFSLKAVERLSRWALSDILSDRCKEVEEMRLDLNRTL